MVNRLPGLDSNRISLARHARDNRGEQKLLTRGIIRGQNHANIAGGF